MIMRLRFITILLFCCGASYAQEHTMTLQQSRQAALAYSNAIKNSRLRINSAEADLASARSAALPSVSGTGVGLFGLKDFIPALPPLLNSSINNLYLLGVTATETLYAGGRVKTGQQLAQLQLEVNHILASQSLDSVLLQTEQKYWSLVNLQEQQKTLDANVKLLDNVLKQQQDLLASGLIARNDMLKVKVQRSQLLLNKSKLENGRRLALLDFSMYTGIRYDSLMRMQDTLDRHSLPALPDLGPDTSLTSNSNFQLLNRNVEAQSLQTVLSRGEDLPALSVGLSASQAGVLGNGVGSTFMPAALATLSVPISEAWWGKGKQKVRQRRINENIAQNNLRDGRNQLKVGIMKSWYDITDGIKEISFARENLEQASENLKVHQDNYKAGLTSITELLNAQAAYQQASGDLVSAYANYHSKVAMYRFMTGKIKAEGDNP